MEHIPGDLLGTLAGARALGCEPGARFARDLQAFEIRVVKTHARTSLCNAARREILVDMCIART